MERFVQLIVAGGVVLVGALWLVALFDRGSILWIVGLVLAVLGSAGLGAGILWELETDLVG
ncbi:hypothetical protein GS429_21235 [Natronorubrum sp. JWXQ-INN-674]|uniref:Uncharacterized protein n=1 Tax=Natronorubrum halalkaliphilum TaxID=2691917 RepID=A0A6B0VSE1_9EURY|nr:hypothetical protein [Natronorubrum halalkaliphilum]MXV64550.1 hypothetical protein [Natronorubrum halalkaliphilum]